MHGRALLDHLETQKEAMLDELAILVGHESPSRDTAALDGLAQKIARRFRARGNAVEIIENPAGGDHVRARFGGSRAEKPALVLTHFDTVWPLGTLGRLPFRIAGGRGFGPGVYDMKASLVILDFAIDAIRSRRAPLPRPARSCS